MARVARVVFPDYPHYVTQRGVRRMNTFFQDDDYRIYKKEFSQACRLGTAETLSRRRLGARKPGPKPKREDRLQTGQRELGL